MVASVGISLVIQSVGWIVFGIQEKSVPSYLPGIVQFLGVRLPRERLLAAGVALVLVAGLYVIVYRTKAGLAMRAIEEDEETARMLGVNANRVASLSVALGFVLAAVAGAFVAPVYSLNPGMGLEPILMSFSIYHRGRLAHTGTGSPVCSWAVPAAPPFSSGRGRLVSLRRADRRARPPESGCSARSRIVRRPRCSVVALDACPYRAIRSDRLTFVRGAQTWPRTPPVRVRLACGHRAPPRSWTLLIV